MVYDIIIIWWGASGLFCAMNAPMQASKLILEKQWNLGTKVLMSGGWRCNFSNMEIGIEKYFWENKKMLPSVFHKFSNTEMVDFLNKNWVKTQVEDNGRIILESGKAQELLDLLVRKTKENDCKIKLNQEVMTIKKDWELFFIKTNSDDFVCKKLVIATGGVSFPNVGTTGYGIDFAKELELKTIRSYPALCGVETFVDFSSISGSSIVWDLQVFHNSKMIYSQAGNLLFTHTGLSGPCVFNATAAIGEHLLKKNKYSIEQVQNNITLKIIIKPENMTKKLASLNLVGADNFMELKIKAIGGIETAKVSWWGICMSEIKPNFEAKKIENLYFIGEALDITGQTWWFNLQWAWSSGFVCGKGFCF